MVTLVRREPVSLFDELFSDFFNRAGYPVAPRRADLPSVIRARMDVVDQGDKYEIVVDLPGVKKDSISVTVEGAKVAIAAEAKPGREVEEAERTLHRERYATSYARSFELPAEVTEDGADARFEDGVLTLALPKRAAVMSKRLTIR